MAISIKESISIGLADILTRKIRSAVTIVGIILGVMSIIVVLAVVNGMNIATLKWMQERGGLNKIEISRNWESDVKDQNLAYFTLNEVRYIRDQIPEAVAMNPSVSERNSILYHNDISNVADVFGVLPDLLLIEEWSVSRGRFIADIDVNQNDNVIVLGSTLARELFNKQEPLGGSVRIGAQVYSVVGVLTEKRFDRKGSKKVFGENALEYMNKRAYIPISSMLHKLSPMQKVEEIEIKTSSPEQSKILKTRLEGIILNLRAGKDVFEVSSIQEMMDTMKRNSMIFTGIFILIAVISLLVGGIVIMNIMLASVKERTREIGVRIAIGARRIDIFIQFLVQTILITSLGGIIGIGLGFSMLGFVGRYLEVTVIASVKMIWTALFVSVGVGLIFGIAPAIRAGNLDPVIALREE